MLMPTRSTGRRDAPARTPASPAAAAAARRRRFLLVGSAKGGCASHKAIYRAALPRERGVESTDQTSDNLLLRWRIRFDRAALGEKGKREPGSGDRPRVRRH